MGETTSQIESHIENKRGDLGSNLQELEDKVKSATDWRQQFQKNPMTMVALAFGGGVLLASMGSGRKRRHSHNRMPSELQTRQPATARQSQKAFETWDNIKGALIGVAATRLKDLVGEIVPGFHEQLRNSEQAKASQSTVPSDLNAETRP